MRVNIVLLIINVIRTLRVSTTSGVLRTDKSKIVLQFWIALRIK